MKSASVRMWIEYCNPVTSVSSQICEPRAKPFFEAITSDPYMRAALIVGYLKHMALCQDGWQSRVRYELFAITAQVGIRLTGSTELLMAKAEGCVGCQAPRLLEQLAVV